MIQTLIGQKIDQAQSFLQNGMRVPVTEINLTDNVVLQVKTMEKDSYAAAQIGAGVRKRPIKAFAGQAKKAGLKATPFKVKEVSLKGVSDEDAPKAGDTIAVDAVFKAGDLVAVTGTSKGKGFAGVVRRYNFRGGPKTHGQSDRHRAPGSIGQTTTPGRVYKGKRMAGRMGSDTVTVKNLTVVDVDSKNNKLYLAGLVPGHKNSWVVITRIGEDKQFVPLLSTKELEETNETEETTSNVADAKVEEKVSNVVIGSVANEEVVIEVSKETSEDK